MDMKTCVKMEDSEDDDKQVIEFTINEIFVLEFMDSKLKWCMEVIWILAIHFDMQLLWEVEQRMNEYLVP